MGAGTGARDWCITEFSLPTDENEVKKAILSGAGACMVDQVSIVSFITRGNGDTPVRVVTQNTFSAGFGIAAEVRLDTFPVVEGEKFTPNINPDQVWVASGSPAATLLVIAEGDKP
jgi:hypothetical protein